MAEAARARYGIRGGRTWDDRAAAGRRIEAEFLTGLQFNREQIASMARELGFSLDPSECADFCHNVARLAEIELQKRALREFLAAQGGS